MKPEILEATIPNQTQSKNSDLEVLSIDHFYRIFLKEKSKYAPSLFCINKSTKIKRKRAPTLNEFKRVIYEYLKIYFFELYILKKPMYFCLGGYMKLITYPPWVRKQKRGHSEKPIACRSDGAFGLFWYYRPTEKMYFMLKIKKLAGSSNMITKIEQIFKQNNNKDLLPTFTEEQRKGKKNKTLYRCIQT